MSTVTRPPRPRPVRPARSYPGTGFEVAAQAIATGLQDHTVQALQPVSGTGSGQIAVRVGRLLVYVTDRVALDSFLAAWREAESLADLAFGPVLPAPVYRPRRAGRRTG